MKIQLQKYSFGVGDRFGMEGRAQLAAILKAEEAGVEVTPVWNKSHREHTTVGTQPESVRKEADEAVKSLGFKDRYFVDADHINKENVDDFISFSDFFTIDVAKFIGKQAEEGEKNKFLKYIDAYRKELKIEGIEDKKIEASELDQILDTFLFAMKKAGEIYRYIRAQREEDFLVEVSIDEVENPQSPVELFFILAALSFYEVPVTTIAPKFTGRFSKGVDYEGDLQQFQKEFEEDLLVIRYAVKEFSFPEALKLSVHSGSDKFSIYPVMNRLIKKHNVGLHLKTAGTTWLEEIIGLAESEGEGFRFAAGVYEKALERYDELTEPYRNVLKIDKKKLPSPEEVRKEKGESFAKALTHDESSEAYNLHLRQLMHCAYKIAAEQPKEFQQLLRDHREQIERNVTFNLFDRHLKPLFISE